MHHKYNTRGAENATMSDDLKIKPEFRDLIPKLTDKEYEQLEANILEAGEVKEPIVIWNGFIVDGHHRWYIIQKHPEIPYTVEEMDFDNEHAAMAWSIRNQIGRRNLTDIHKDYLLGIEYDEEKLASGGTGANQYTKVQPHHNDEPAKTDRGTSGRLAEKHDLSPSTIQRRGQLRRGIDAVGEISPELKGDILSKKVKVTQTALRKMASADSETKEKAVELISSGEVHKAEVVLSGMGDVYDDGDSVEYTEDDLKQELEANFDKAMDSLKTTRETYYDLLGDPEVNNHIIDFLIELHEFEIIGLREEKANG